MNSLSFLGLKRTSSFLFLAGLAILAAVGLIAAREKDKGDYPDYTRLEYSKPLPPVEEQVRQPPPGSINRKFGEVPEDVNQGADPLNSIPIPLLRPASKVDNSEPPISEILEESDIFNSTPMARETFKTAPIPVSTAPASRQ